MYLFKICITNTRIAQTVKELLSYHDTFIATHEQCSCVGKGGIKIRLNNQKRRDLNSSDMYGTFVSKTL